MARTSPAMTHDVLTAFGDWRLRSLRPRCRRCPTVPHAQSIPGALPKSTKALSQGEWPAYAGTSAAARYSPLTQIDRTQRQKSAYRLALEIA